MRRLYFKVLGEGRVPIYGGKGRWPSIGNWTKPKKVNPCHSGYHLARPRDLRPWLSGSAELYLAEGAGVYQIVEDKVVFERARLIEKLPWNEETAKSWTLDCADRAIQLLLNDNNKKSPRGRELVASGKLVRAAKDFLAGRISLDEWTSRHKYHWAAWPTDSSYLIDNATRWAVDLVTGWVAGDRGDHIQDVCRYAALITGDSKGRWQIRHLMTNYLGLRLVEWQPEWCDSDE